MVFGTETEACRAWVDSFNAIPSGIIEKLLQLDEWALEEVTEPCQYDTVWVYDEQKRGEITRIIGDPDPTYCIEFDDGTSGEYELKDFEVEHDDALPMWGTLWAFGDSIDNDWLEGTFDTDGIRKMSECGFRIYRNEDYGFIFGIDGAGYDFYEQHWLPLYRMRGLQWHRTEPVSVEAESITFNPDTSVTAVAKFNGVKLNVNLPPHKYHELFFAMQDRFDLDDVESEIEHWKHAAMDNQERKELMDKRIACLSEYKTDVADLYRDILDNLDDWHNALDTAINEILNEHGL